MASLRNLIARAFGRVSRMVEPPRRTIDITDEYLKWLCFANAGMLERGNLYLMDYALSRIKSSAPLVEIGSFCGLSANALTHFKRKYGLKNQLITCDRWDFEIGEEADREHVAGSPVLRSDYKGFVRDSYLRNTGLFSADDLPYTVEATSDDFYEQWQHRAAVLDVRGRTLQLGGPMSFCYIDGNHTYEYAKRDFLNCHAFLERGGFILFDDSSIQEFGVQRLMSEVANSGEYRLVATNPNHLFQKLDT
jgi:hypothetical protein